MGWFGTGRARVEEVRLSRNAAGTLELCFHVISGRGTVMSPRQAREQPGCVGTI